MKNSMLIAVALLGFAGAQAARAGEANWSPDVDIPAGTGVYHTASYPAPVPTIVAAVSVSVSKQAAPVAHRD